MINALAAMSREQLDKMTQEELVAAIVEGRTETVVVDYQVEEGLGQLHQATETRDADGNVLETSETNWTYHDDGSVDVIETVVQAADSDQATVQTVRHEDGEVSAAVSVIAKSWGKPPVKLGGQAVSGVAEVGG